MNVRFCTQLTFKRRRCKSCFSPMPASSLATCCMKQNSLRIFESSLKQNSSLAQSGLSAFGLWCSIPTCTSPTQPYIYICVILTGCQMYTYLFTRKSATISSISHPRITPTASAAVAAGYLIVFYGFLTGLLNAV